MTSTRQRCEWNFGHPSISSQQSRAGDNTWTRHMANLVDDSRGASYQLVIFMLYAVIAGAFCYFCADALRFLVANF
jgi:hypothetical protein